MKTSLGVDLGATWLRACLAHEGRELWSTRVPAVDWRQLPKTLSKILLTRGRRRAGRIMIGGTRLGGVKERATLRRAMARFSSEILVVPDFEIAHLAAFGRGCGVILVASTGSAAFARGLDGRRQRAGGWGPLLGDEGSGFWLGKQALHDPALSRTLPSALTLAHSADPVRATAALAPRVLRRSSRLREAAAAHLADLARRAARGLRLPRRKPLALHGSLFKNGSLRRAVLRRLGTGWEISAPRVSAAKAAAGLLPQYSRIKA